MRIALVAHPFFTIPPDGYAGTERMCFWLWNALREAGHRVFLHTISGKGSLVHEDVIKHKPGESYARAVFEWLSQNVQNVDVAHFMTDCCRIDPDSLRLIPNVFTVHADAPVSIPEDAKTIIHAWSSRMRRHLRDNFSIFDF